jgi:hypothetical protein
LRDEFSREVISAATAGRFQVVTRTFAGSGDSPSAKATTKDASKANEARFTAPRLISLSVREKDFSTDGYSRSLGNLICAPNAVLGIIADKR